MIRRGPGTPLAPPSDVSVKLIRTLTITVFLQWFGSTSIIPMLPVYVRDMGQVLEAEWMVGPGQCMTLGDHEHQVLLEEHPGHQVAPADRQVEDGQIQMPGGQLRLESGGGSFDDDHAELGVALRDGVHQPGNQPAGRGADHPYPDRPGYLVLAGGHIGQQGVELGQDAAGPGHDDHALFGQAPVGPVDQRGAQLLLQTGHMGRNIGLDGAEVLSCRRERPVVADGGESLQVSEFHRSKR